MGDEDIAEGGSVLEPGRSAAMLLYENRWAAPFMTALRVLKQQGVISEAEFEVEKAKLLS